MNDYRLSLDALQRRLPMWLLLSLLAAGITYALLTRWGPTYTVHFSYVVSLAERETSAEYTFDGYYALQATDLFTATLAGWVTAPEVIVESYQAADLPVPAQSARALRRSVEARKTAPQLVEVRVSSAEQGTAERLTRGLQTVMEQNVERYHNEAGPRLPFTAIPTSPWTSVSERNVALVVISVFFVALVLLVNGQLVWETMARADRD